MFDKRAHIFYEGAVQGVGFRFTAERVASSLGISGWVRNLSDGRVEILCEGSEPSLNLFMEKLYSVFKRNLANVDIEWCEAKGDLDAFDIRFDR